jgi:DNA-binding protein HU-beta
MNKLEPVEHVASEADLPKVSAEAALEAVLDGIAKALRNGDKVRLVGFGTFSMREGAAGTGRHAWTGKEIKIVASKNARFKAGTSPKGAAHIALLAPDPEEMADIITRVSKWAGGQAEALTWYRAQPISTFGDRTAESLVKSGQATALREYLDSIALGGFA